MHFTIYVDIKEWVHCVIQTDRWAEPVFRTSVGAPATFKEELPVSREALIKAGCAKRGEGV